MSREGKGSALLFEITIVLFFFAISATVILSMFMRANDMSVSGRIMNETLFAAQDMAECLYASGNQPDEYLTSVGFMQEEGEYRRDSNGFAMAVRIEREATDAGTLYRASVEVLEKEIETRLPLAWYVPDWAEVAT